MQRGQIFLRNRAWHLRFYRDEIRDGQPVRRRVCQRLASYSDEYRSKRDVLPLAQDILAPVNIGEVRPESSLTITEFIEQRYFPARANRLRPSTIAGYKEVFQNHIVSRVGSIRLRNFRTVDAQHLLDALAERKPELSHQTLLRVRALLSSVFTFARQEDVLRGVNPIQGTKAEGRHYKPERSAYSLEDIHTILAKLKEPAKTIVATAAFSGLRKSELRGLRWEDFSGVEIHVRRSVWRTHEGPTKTEESSESVPVIPILRRVLDRHRLNNPGDGYIFSGAHGDGRPLYLDNLARRVLLPILGSLWKGWHGFRRGLASNLYQLGVPDKTIQAILRHGSVSTTQRSYILVNRSETRAAMKKLERAMGNKRARKKL